MKTKALRTEILASFFAIIAVLGISVAAVGYYVIKNDIINRAQKQVESDLNVARLVYDNQLETIEKSFSVIRYVNEPEELKKRLGLDYFYVVEAEGRDALKSEIASEAFNGKGAGGTRLIGREELKGMGADLLTRSEIEIKYTAKARPTEKKVLSSALAIECARPFSENGGKVTSVIYGGKIINRDFYLVDGIRNNVFENRFVDSKPMGTVTIFLDDTRIATNVLDASGNRAIGTRVSKSVYDNVIGKGKMWLDRAFVVTDWYLTAYEPITDIKGKTIGILYVGILEKPFIDLRRNILFVYLAIILLGIALASVLSFILNRTITKPFNYLIEATSRLSEGELDHRIRTETHVAELDQLGVSFNKMAEKLEALNKSYIDLIGFVSHEMKGILGSVSLNVYSLKEGILGSLNDTQKRALDSTARSLDHFESMVKNYLDLSRIEKGELKVKKTDTELKEDIIKVALANYEKQITEKKILVEDLVPEGIRLQADKDLLLIVCDNLISNAIKYNSPGGKIAVRAEADDRNVKVEVYNDGRPIKEEEKGMLFKRFSRLPGSEKIKGTGIGLFITKEIVEKHGGNIWVEPQESGNKILFTIPR